MSLSELNRTTAKSGKWYLKVVHSGLEEYSYSWQGKQLWITKLRVCFVSMNEKEYCVGIMRPKNKNVEELRKARDETFKESKIFIATKVAFIDEKPQYIHAPFKTALDLRNTRFTPVLAGTVVLPDAPSPGSTVTEILSIQETKGHRFDITGLCHLSAVRYHDTQKGYRAIIDVTLLDDSKLHNEKTGELEFTIFVPCTPGSDCPPGLTSLITLVEANNPVSFFSLTLSVQQGERDINTYNGFYWKAAQGEKADRLKAMAGELLNLSAEKKEKLTIDFTPKTKRDFLSEPAVQSCCCLLSTCTALDNSPFAHDKVFQINYASLTPPGIGASVLTTDGRVWLPRIVVSDQTSSFTLGMREKAALELAGFKPDDAEAKAKFVDLVKTGELPFPMLASIRVCVQKKGSKLQFPQDAATPDSQDFQDSQTQASEEMRAVIVEAVDEDITVKPNKAYLAMFPLTVTTMKQLIAMSDKTTFEGNKRHPTWTSEDNPVEHVKKKPPTQRESD